jgi:cysteine sulfinate desulfinase/cysteine desulfurase-like protein
VWGVVVSTALVGVVLVGVVIYSSWILIPQEHKCVLDSCRAIENEGFSVTYLPVKQNGEIDLKVMLV